MDIEEGLNICMMDSAIILHESFTVTTLLTYCDVFETVFSG